MGYGDDLLVTALAANLKKKFPYRQIVIGNFEKKQAYHSVIYDNNPNISDCRNLDTSKPIHMIDYHPGNRPYIDYHRSTSSNYVWNKKYKPIAGQIFFSEDEKKQAKKILEDAKKFWNKNYNALYESAFDVAVDVARLEAGAVNIYISRTNRRPALRPEEGDRNALRVKVLVAESIAREVLAARLSYGLCQRSARKDS